MAIIQCPECGDKVSSEAKTCPHCGYPMKKADVAPVKAEKPVPEKEAKPEKTGHDSGNRNGGKKKWLIALLAVVVVAAVAVFAIVLPAAKESKKTPFKTVGNIVTFGTYPQTAEGTDRTPIEWIVLDYDAANHRALLLSRYGLDAKPYNEEYTDITWEKCTLRTWLNGDFLKTAFNAGEQSAILVTDVDNSAGQGYSEWNTNSGNNTRDRIFLLSYAEANRYFEVQHYSVSGSDKNLKSRVAPTAYAIGRGASTDSSKKTENGEAVGWWWLLSPGQNQSNAASVDYGGSLRSGNVSFDYGCVRPAFWINLESDIF